jgi:hypothetical protein
VVYGQFGFTPDDIYVNSSVYVRPGEMEDLALRVIGEVHLAVCDKGVVLVDGIELVRALVAIISTVMHTEGPIS